MIKRYRTIENLWNWWKRVARKIGDIQARVLLILFYFTVFSPFALAVRCWTDPLTIKPGSQQGWHGRPEREGLEVERATRQF